MRFKTKKSSFCLLGNMSVIFFLIVFSPTIFADNGNDKEDFLLIPTKTYTFDDGTVYKYKRHSLFGWFTNGFKNIIPFTKNTFAEDNMTNLALILGSTAVLVHYDQKIYDQVSSFGADHRISQDSTGSSAFELPQDTGNYLYFIGDGRIPLAITGYMAGVGYYHDDLRMMSTASQLLEMTVSVGIVAQVIKQLTGRETPAARTQDGGKWHGYVGIKEYVRNRTRYDAVPSGHLATAVATITVLAENYHEHEVAIYSVGGVLATLLSLQMINNGVHWAGDYPIAIGLGYSMGKLVAKNNREVLSDSNKSELSYHLVPGINSIMLQASMKI